MNKFNKYLNNESLKIAKLFLYLQPLMDIATAIGINTFSLNINLSLILRGLFLMFSVYYLLFINDSKYRKKSIFYIVIITSYIFLFSINVYINKRIVFYSEITNTIKTFYFVYLLLFLFNIYSKNKPNIKNKDFIVILLFYLLNILVPSFFNIGYDSYAISKVGQVGLFNSANDVSIIISIIIPMLFINLSEKKEVKITLITTLVLLPTIFIIGTKSIILSLAITLIILSIYVFIYLIKNRIYKKLIYLIISLIVTLIAGFLIIPKTNFYKNIEIHLEFLEVDSITDIIFNLNNIDHFIFSQRGTFLNNTYQIYEESSIKEKLLGIGYHKGNDLNNLSSKKIEMDYFDILFSHGVIGFLIYFYIYMKVILYIIKNNKVLKNLKNILNFAIVFVIFSLALIVGHTLTSPSASTFVAFILITILYNSKYDFKKEVNL